MRIINLLRLKTRKKGLAEIGNHKSEREEEKKGKKIKEGGEKKKEKGEG